MHGAEELKKTYLAKLVTGEWTGTMQLTEPQAGSDVGALRTKAERDGRRHLSHQRPEDLHHLWRARSHRQHHPLRARAAARCAARHQGHFAFSRAEIPGERRRLARRAQRCALHSLEHKLGIHASPTCTMVYGDQGGAVGYLVGEENAGIACSP